MKKQLRTHVCIYGFEMCIYYNTLDVGVDGVDLNQHAPSLAGFVTCCREGACANFHFSTGMMNSFKSAPIVYFEFGDVYFEFGFRDGGENLTKRFGRGGVTKS